MFPIAIIGFLGSLREIHVSKLLLGRKSALKESIDTSFNRVEAVRTKNGIRQVISGI
jgi:hypothetical protein